MKTWIVALACALLLGSSSGARADAGSDAFTKLVQLMEQAATIVDATKNNCDAMGDRLDAFYQANAQTLQEAKAATERLPDDQRRALTARYRQRLSAAMAKLQPAMRCTGNAKIAALLQLF
jgi:DNA-directed RNA polymerase specialized sigma24 family protein